MNEGDHIIRNTAVSILLVLEPGAGGKTCSTFRFREERKT
jgi:hypothetical protein